MGEVPVVSCKLRVADYWGAFKARWGVGRMHYTVHPGLYAIGRPEPDSPVLATANYKLTFDSLRERLSGLNAWLLVLDTKGINVWCAAGKHTFGTDELVSRIESSRLAEMVSHRRVILPQLAGPGVAAHKVKRASGFRVTYGPVRAQDIPAFIDAGLEATEMMRRKTFSTRERTVLVPVELVDAIKAAVLVLPVFFFLAGLGGPQGYWSNVWTYGVFAVCALLAAIFTGSVLTPILLPWLPGRAFSLKAFELGLLVALILTAIRIDAWASWPGRLEILAWWFLVPAVAAYLGMNFTGASTYTSLSGVKKEMRIAVPLQIASVVIGVALWLGSRLAA